MKKILAVLAATAVALTLIGCDLLANKAGQGQGKGEKDNYTITVDATAEAKKPLAEGIAYRRFMKQLGSSEQVAEITTTITFNDKDSTIGDSVIGLAFDFNKAFDETTSAAKADTDTEKLRDFYVVGVKPSTKKAYVEFYNDINFKDEFDTSDSAIGTSQDNVFGGGSWAAVTEGTDYTKEDGVYTLVISIKQSTPGQYDVYLGDKKLGTTKKAGNYKGTKALGTENYAVGGVSTYVNVPKDCKMVVTYTTEKDTVKGKFNADEE